MTESNIRLTVAEIGSIWTSYMNNSMSKCILEYFLKHADDQEIRPVVQRTYDLTTEHLNKLTQFFLDEGLPIPAGFTDEDVNLNAGRLYTDTFMLTYINHMAKVGMLAYSGFVSMSSRKDVRDHFMGGLHQTSKLYDISSDVALSKGVFTKPPYIPYPTETDMIDSKSYVKGLNPFSKNRPLNAIEIAYLFFNIQTNLIGGKLSLGFAQISPREDIQKWMLRGRDITNKHIKIFTEELTKNNLEPSVPSDNFLTDSTTPPFSDKLAMFLMTLLSAAGMGNYATAAGASQRSDLVLNYERLSVEIAQYAKDGADIMIKNEWLEQPPGTKDKDKLAKTKKS